MNKNEVLSKIKKDDCCFVYDGVFNTGYKIIDVTSNFVITLDLTNKGENNVVANETYDLKQYDVKIDDCRNKIEVVEFGIEFYNNNEKKLAIEIY